MWTSVVLGQPRAMSLQLVSTQMDLFYVLVTITPPALMVSTVYCWRQLNLREKLFV